MRERPGQLWHCAFLFGFFAFHGERSGHNRGARRWGFRNATLLCSSRYPGTAEVGCLQREMDSKHGRWRDCKRRFWSRLHGRAVTQPTPTLTLTQSET
ncbi:hypothetical protein GQ607_011251 [Colletotrichum asianum]|uniref:Uncharacterized protein n=1 Tax=Colletotrichum asianum TaxID=702518 RepID=A0A8H3ZPJ7_9PEZI|nr:hypothetical protein GQ607_011251 [Colletotrichum asianum]